AHLRGTLLQRVFELHLETDTRHQQLGLDLAELLGRLVRGLVQRARQCGERVEIRAYRFLGHEWFLLPRSRGAWGPDQGPVVAAMGSPDRERCYSGRRASSPALDRGAFIRLGPGCQGRGSEDTQIVTSRPWRPRQGSDLRVRVGVLQCMD